MYRCAICRGVSPPRRPRLTHVIHREDGNIARELSVCARCQRELAEGAALEAVQASRKPALLTVVKTVKTVTQPKPGAFALGEEL